MKKETQNSAKSEKKYQKPMLRKYKVLKKLIASGPIGITQI